MHLLKRLGEFVLASLVPPSQYETLLKQHTARSLLRAARAKHQPKANHTHAVLSYTELPARALIRQLKYHDDAHAAEMAGELMYATFFKNLPRGHRYENSALASIPLHPKRLRERGYNQADRVARALLVHMTHTNEALVYIPDLLVRTRDTKSQTRMSHKKRSVNIANCFSMSDQHDVLGKDVFLIDDVTTTGSTFNEARRVLLRAGARSVDCFAVAH